MKIFTSLLKQLTLNKGKPNKRHAGNLRSLRSRLSGISPKHLPSFLPKSDKILGEISDKCSVTLHIFRDDGSGFWRRSGVLIKN